MACQPDDREDSYAKSRKWGNFELLALVGRGSFGEVFRAWDPHLQREIGLKLLRQRSIGEAAQFEQLLREARALASVRHPNIVPIYGVDRYDGLVGFWTDFVHGKTLAQVVREQGPYGFSEAALVGLDVCKALSAVHRAGLLHRDIKAENVMREEGGRILLMDFGLSTLLQGQADLAGTPRYMAPELFRGAPASIASDVYSVGVLLFYLVSGEYPGQRVEGGGAAAQPDLRGDEATAEASNVHSLPTDLRPRSGVANATESRSVIDYRPDIPEAFARIIDTAIHPAPLKRFSSAGALSAALADVLAGPVAGDAVSQAPEMRRKRQPKWVYEAALAVLLLTVAGGLVYFVQGRTARGAHSNPAATLGAEGGLNDKYLQAEALLERYDKRQNVADAIVLLQQVLAQDANYALAQAGLGQALFLQYRVTRIPDQLDQARAACNRAIQLDADLAPPFVTLARIDAMAGNTALATQEVQKALKIDPRSAEAYGAQAEVFNAEGRSADAMASVQKAMDLAPESWRWPVLLGSYYFGAGRLQEAAEQFRNANDNTPNKDNATALLDLGLVSLQLNRLDEARSSFEKSAQIEPSFAAYSALAELLTTEGKSTDAVEIATKAKDLSPANYVAWGNLASAYLWNPGGHDKAMEAYRKAIELAEVSRKQTPEDAPLLAALGGFYADIGQSDRGLALLRKAVALAPDDPNVLFRAGDGFEASHHRSEAIHLIAKSLARGYHANQLERSPELAGLRADVNFQKALIVDKANLSLDKAKESR